MLKVIKPGFYTSIQDAGRFGYRNFGVPVSGVMDSYSGQFANAILGNVENAAVLEITMTGPVLQFLEPTIISISGADMQPKLNDSSVRMHTSISVRPHDILSFGPLQNGFRAYLAVKDGFLSSSILESRSMYKSITASSKLKKEDCIAYKGCSETKQTSHANVKYNLKLIDSAILDVFKGPEFSSLPTRLQKQLLDANFNISQLHNRMAYQFESRLENSLEQILTAPVLPGIVQLTPKGNLIVLMRDCQTTGGYPRVLQLNENAINCLSQKTTGNSIKFRLKDL